MPPISDGTHPISDQGLTVTTRTMAGDDCRAYVGLTGDVDMAACAVLFETLDWLISLAPVSVLIDLADVAFACSTLPNFVARVRHAVPDGVELVLWRARPATKWVLQVTAMAAIATIHDEPAEVVGLLAY